MVKGYWLKGIGMFSFERLDVYQKARELVKDVYQLHKIHAHTIMMHSVQALYCN